MNWLDVSLALAMVISIFTGLHAGFAKTGVGFLASVLGLVLGLQYYRLVAVNLRPYIHRGEVANMLGFLIVFCGITIVGSVASGLLARFFRGAQLTWLDRVLGGAFGVVRGVFIATVAIWVLMAFVPVLPQQAVADSRLAPYVMGAARKMADASPEEVKLTFRRSYRELNKMLPEHIKERLANVPPGQI